MSETVFDPEYGRVASPQENGISEKRDRSQDLEDFCVETIVFENKESILDAVLGVSKGESVTESCGGSPQSVVENSNESALNGHLESPSTDHIRENIIVSEYKQVCTNDDVFENGCKYDEVEATKETDLITDKSGSPNELGEKEEANKVFEESINEKNIYSENCLQEEEVKDTLDEAISLEKIEMVEEKEPQIQNGGIITQTETTADENDRESIEVKDTLGGGDLTKELAEELPNGHESIVEEQNEAFEEREESEIPDHRADLLEEGRKADLVDDNDAEMEVDDNDAERKVDDNDAERKVDDNDAERKVDDNDAEKDGDEEDEENEKVDEEDEKDGIIKEKDIEEEALIKDDTGNHVLNFIRKKTRSLGRNAKNVRLSSKSDEGQLIETTEKSKKNPLFKIFSKEKPSKEDEQVKNGEKGGEEEQEVDSEDKMSKSYTKMGTQEAKQDKKHFKFFKNVFHKSDKKNKHEAGDKVDAADPSENKSSNGVVDSHDKSDVSTDNVVPTYHQTADLDSTSPNKLFTITELEAEKACVAVLGEAVVGSESLVSQEGYQCGAGLAKEGEEIFQQMMNKNLNAPDGDDKEVAGGGDDDDGGNLKSEIVQDGEDVSIEIENAHGQSQAEVVVESGEIAEYDDDTEVLKSDSEVLKSDSEVLKSDSVDDAEVIKSDSVDELKEESEVKDVVEEITEHSEAAEVEQEGQEGEEEQEVKEGQEGMEEQEVKEGQEGMEGQEGDVVSNELNTEPSQVPAEVSEECIVATEEGITEQEVKPESEAATELVKEHDDEPKKIKRKNFILTLPSFKFSGFSKGEGKTVETATRREERRSVDGLDKVVKTKKVKKRTKSFHFGKRSKKVDEEEQLKVVVSALDADVKRADEEDLNKSDLKSKFSTLKWRKFSKKTDKKDEIIEIKDSKQTKENKDIKQSKDKKEVKESKENKEAGKEEDKHNESRTSRQSRQGTLTRSFLKFFSRKASDVRANDLNGMVYSLEDNMVIAADKSVSFGGCYESGQVLQEGDAGKSFVVVAIDFGTTFSGYAFSFMGDHHSEHHPIHIMRKWEGGDPGVNNQKTPTIILLTPNQDFHTFGFTARDFYHNLDATESAKWLYFDKFKMALHNMDIHENLTIPAANGVHVSALKLFSFALKYFKEHAIKELTSQSATEIKAEDIRWVITVPAIWKAPAKQFMRKAAHLAEITSVEGSGKLLIALEPEAASIYIRRLKRSQLVPEKPTPAFLPSDLRPSSPQRNGGATGTEVIDDQLKSGTRYIVVDCGGGTVDLTVHEMEREGGLLKELYKATGGPYGSIGVDQEFEQLLRDIFGSDFIDSFKVKRPAGWVDLMIAFESRKRTCSPFKNHQHNISMPFSFIDFHKKFSHNTPIDDVVRRFNDSNIKWSPQGMLRLSPEAMSGLFESTVTSIISLISNVIVKSQVQGIEYLFLVGGFAESPLLQNEVRKHFEEKVKVIIPQDVSLTILRGAVCYGLDPTVVSLRRSHLTYGIGVVHKFIAGEHDPKKLVRRDGVEWCADVFDGFVKNNQPVSLNDSVIRRYAAIGKQDCVTICVYSSEEKEVKYVTDPGVRKCATLTLKLDVEEKKADEKAVVEGEGRDVSERRAGDGSGEANGAVTAAPAEAGSSVVKGGGGKSGGIKQIDAVMTFGDTEIKVTALEVDTGKSVKATIDFLNL